MKSVFEIETHICTLIEEVSLESIKARDVASESKIILDLGLDSLDYATILLACEKWLQIKISENGVEWNKIQTVRELAEFLSSEQTSHYDHS
jgi:acyl carrier protein